MQSVNIEEENKNCTKKGLSMKVEREKVELRTDHPHYGEIVKDHNGKIVCHICGKSFVKLGSHVYQVHGIISREYKIMFGLEATKGLIPDEHRAILSSLNRKYYDLVVAHNLLKCGENTRFKKNSPGRTRNLISEQTMRKLSAHGREVFHKMRQKNNY